MYLQIPYASDIDKLLKTDNFSYRLDTLEDTIDTIIQRKAHVPILFLDQDLVIHTAIAFCYTHHENPITSDPSTNQVFFLNQHKVPNPTDETERTFDPFQDISQMCFRSFASGKNELKINMPSVTQLLDAKTNDDVNTIISNPDSYTSKVFRPFTIITPMLLEFLTLSPINENNPRESLVNLLEFLREKKISCGPRGGQIKHKRNLKDIIRFFCFLHINNLADDIESQKAKYQAFLPSVTIELTVSKSLISTKHQKNRI